MKSLINELTVNGKKYILEDRISTIPETIENYVIIRSKSAGVFMGELAHRKGQEVELNNAIRIWYWDGAASCSQLAMDGVSKPENCKFSIPTMRQTIFEVIEIIPVTQKAFDSIIGVKSWTK